MGPESETGSRSSGDSTRAGRSASLFLIAFAQYLLDSLHDWHLKILLVAAIIRHLAHFFFQVLKINHSVVAFDIIVTAEPRGDDSTIIEQWAAAVPWLDWSRDLNRVGIIAEAV